MRLMCAGHEEEIELVKKELVKAGIVSETRPHPMAEALGVNGLELWVRNEQDFSNASRLYTHVLGKAVNIPEAPPSRKAENSKVAGSVPNPQAGPSSTPPKDVKKAELTTSVAPCVELNEASSLLQKGIEQMFSRERELTSECASLHGKVEELSQSLAQAQANLLREIKNQETAEQAHTTRLTGLLDTLERERREWQQKLKSSEDACKHAKEQAGSLSRRLETQQASATALKQEVTALELQRDQQEQALSDARKEAAAEREVRIAAEERTGLAEKSLQMQLAERQELERQVQAHTASLSSLLNRVTAKASGSGKP
ncbi:MAG TPA: hypothetical protein VLT36_10665 [Candidatus Dormibacteraeota bacterium]|nr:hypothetical protein [Candidatus Dormibacteraeota bacterium]